MKDVSIARRVRQQGASRSVPGAMRPKAAGLCAIGLLLILHLLPLGTPAAAASSMPADVSSSGFPDATGASGEIQAAFLNPAAAAGLQLATASAWVVVAGPDGSGEPSTYTLALLDPGERLAGGFVATLSGAGATQPLSLSYSVAGRFGPVAAGLRPVWTRIDLPAGLWTLDAGFAWRVASWVSLGVAGLDLSISPEPTSDRSPARGLLGLTFTATPLEGTLLQGTQLSLGLSMPDLDAPDGTVAQAGLRVPLGQQFRLALGYEHDPRSGQALRWMGSVAVQVDTVRLDLAYQTDDVYRAGIAAGW